MFFHEESNRLFAVSSLGFVHVLDLDGAELQNLSSSHWFYRKMSR
jgi:hypothetical protein